MTSLNGIVYRSANQELIHLLLEEVAVKVLICDVSAKVVLTQTFTNTSETSTNRAKYVFPIPSRAAVCAFDLTHADGRVIVGVSKEKLKAIEEHDKAIREGKSSGLLEWVTDDIFTISVGSIPAKQSIITRLAYVLDLMDDEAPDEVRFQLPVAIGRRYGPIPASMENAASASNRTRLRITADIQTSGRLHTVKSPTHMISLSPYKTHLGRVSNRRTTAKFRSATFLESDFVLVIRAAGLDGPRCFAERDLRGPETIAMQLTIVPKFKPPPIPAQEFMFIVDRSGSMAGSRIETAKRTLKILLRMLPGSLATFNIFSFGSEVDSLWPRSCSYTPDTLDYATNHIDGMSANYGGTEICAALAFALGARSSHMPTVAFVLTDGESNDIDNTISTVTRAVAVSTPDTPLRIFTLGIGKTISTAMCEGIARAGHGFCLLAVSNEDIIGKCARLFRAGRSSILEDVSIDWGVPSEYSSNGIIRFVPSTNSSRDQPPTVQIAPVPAMQQTPHQIVNIDPGMRFVIFMISTHKNVPKHITIRGRFNGTSTPFTHTVPVELVKPFSDEQPDIPLVHILAARRLITDFEENRAPLPTASPGSSVEDIRKAVIVRLGEEYQLASRHTSFVAVDADASPARGLNDSQGRSLRLRTRRPNNQQYNNEGQTSNSLTEFAIGSLFNTFAYISSTVGAVFSFFQRGTARGRSTHRIPGEFPSSRAVSPSPTGSQVSQTTGSFSTLSSLNGSLSAWTSSRTPSPSPPPPDEADHARSPSPPVESLYNATPAVQKQYGFDSRSTDPSASSSTTPPVASHVFDLIHLQAFDGSYPLNHSFGEIIGHDILGRAAEFQADDKAWATALAVAYFKKHLSKQPDLLECLLDKAMEFARGNKNFDTLVTKASALL